MPVFMLLLVGDNGVGKNTCLQSIMGHECVLPLESLYIANCGVIHQIVFQTNRGPIKFKVWDTAGLETHGQIGDDITEKLQATLDPTFILPPDLAFLYDKLPYGAAMRGYLIRG